MRLNFLSSIFRNISFIFLFTLSSIFAQPKHEVRAVWVSTNYNLDWPPKGASVEEKKKSLVKIFKDIRSRKFNTVYLQVRSGGTLIYPSGIEPVMNEFEEDANDFNPLEFALNEAHKLNLKLYAWVNVLNVTKQGNGNSVSTLHPNWVIPFQDAGSVKYWLDPGLPEVREYLVKLMEELTSNYNLDGIILDYLRYPGKNFNDSFSYTLYSQGMNKSVWRRNNIIELLDSTFHSVKRINPKVKIAITPLGIYKNDKHTAYFSAYEDAYQDAIAFVKNNIADFIIPQIYWSIENKPSFKKLLEFWCSAVAPEKLVISLGAYKTEIIRQLYKQISLTRTNNTGGFSVYRYSNIKNRKDIRFNNYVLPDLGTGKKLKPPKNILVNVNSQEPFSLILGWNKEIKAENYLLYEFEGIYSDLLSVIDGKRNTIRMEIEHPKSKYEFRLTYLDKEGNESDYGRKIILDVDSIKVANENIPDDIKVLLKNSFLVINSDSNSEVELFSPKGFLGKLPVLKGQNIIPVKNIILEKIVLGNKIYKMKGR